MPDLSPILARTRDDEIMKIIFGVGAVIVWGIFQAIAAIAKKAEDAKRRQKYGRLPEDVATRRPNFPVPPPVPTRQRSQASKAKGKGRGTKRPIPVPARPTAPHSPIPQSATPQYAAVVEGPKGRAKEAGDVAPANRVGRLLRQPGTLRAAFVLNEVLSKPVALRDELPARY